MRVADIKNEIQVLTNYTFPESKITSLIHRVKVKENANELLFKGIKKMFNFWGEGYLTEVKEYCFSIDFDEINKSKHGGRGKDKSPRLPHGMGKRIKERKERNERNRMSYWNEQQSLGSGGSGGSWIDPPNM